MAADAASGRTDPPAEVLLVTVAALYLTEVIQEIGEVPTLIDGHSR